MGIRNYLIEGVSGAGKTSVCNELHRRGYQAIHGDRELAYQGDPETGTPTDGTTYEHHVWHVDKVKALVSNEDEEVTFFCGDSRDFSKFIDLFDDVFVLEVDLETSLRRIDERVAQDQTDWGGRPEEREIVARA
ncbi:AAA family ATPase [Alicyclobacillus acidiphilus]|uniref:AAA family ATPase n=1 Tax=Alicyclobacillus acidiphilus TaxID=182455 RepID=UPI000A854990|nr:AAA family ATPase [Alicyclobacillus acidiphilus]